MSADLDILLAEYQAVRDDDRGHTNSLATLASVFVALLAGLFAILVGDCQFRGNPAGEAKKAGACYELPDPVYVAAPALPLAVLCYIVMIGIQVTIKNFYLRAIENELRKHSVKLGALEGVVAGSATELMLMITSPRRGRRAYLAMLLFLTLSFVIALGGWIAFAAMKVSPVSMIVMFSVYGPMLALLVHQGIQANTGGRSLLAGAIRRLLTDGSYPDTRITSGSSKPPDNSERTLLSYLVIPRPLDMIKWLFIPIAYALGVLLTASIPTFREVAIATASWMIFEYLLYQGRYQVNDIRGVADDQAHPSRKNRGRLPIKKLGPRASITLSTLIALTRLALAGFISLTLLPSSTTVVMMYSFIGIVLPAILYEVLRTGNRLGHLRAIAIWLTVGAGYAVRVSVGLILAGITPTGATSRAFILLTASAWAFGIVFVTMTWAIEATGHCTAITQAKVSFASNLTAKPHLFRLLHFTNLSLSPTMQANGSGSTLRPLIGKTPVLSPWNLSLLAATGCAVAPFSLKSPLLLISLALVAALSLVLNSSNRMRWYLSATSIAILPTVSYFTEGLFSGIGIAVTLSLFFAVYCCFRQASYYDLSRTLSNMKKSFHKLAIASKDKAAILLLGRRTLTFVKNETSGRGY
ncbi:hypothetical protein AB0N89_20365 [Amycolatopsis sp. NPDC089917]|uniref:hypothetical protein n=1 Tax=Amycolatopsis sp. NPDC089917 TaxID=3155187 RepID=UPI00341FE2AC